MNTTFDSRIHNNLLIVAIDGMFALDAVEEGKNYLTSLIETSATQGVLINCDKMTRIDSSGVGFMVSLFKRFKDQNISFGLCCLNKLNLNVFNATKLDQLIKIYDSEDRAISAMQV